MKTMTVVRGDGRIIHGLDKADVVAELKKAQAEGDRYTTVIGWISAGLDYEELEREANYQGASEQECLDDLNRLAGVRA
jgi:hypothetical protein